MDSFSYYQPAIIKFDTVIQHDNCPDHKQISVFIQWVAVKIGTLKCLYIEHGITNPGYPEW